MTITTIYRIFFFLNEYKEMLEFASAYKNYSKIAEDTTGTTYELEAVYTVNVNEGAPNDEITME